MRPVRLLFPLLMVVLVGCVVRVNQLDTAKRLLTGSSASRKLADYAWVFGLNGARIVVYPVQAVGRNVLFASGDGLRLTWDGESIIVIEGYPGALGRLESGIDGAERWYARAGQPIFRATCGGRREWQLSSSRFGWRQECTGELDGRRVSTQHLVEFDGGGNVQLIEATLIPGAPPVQLQRIQR